GGAQKRNRLRLAGAALENRAGGRAADGNSRRLEGPLVEGEGGDWKNSIAERSDRKSADRGRPRRTEHGSGQSRRASLRENSFGLSAPTGWGKPSWGGRWPYFCSTTRRRCSAST